MSPGAAGGNSLYNTFCSHSTSFCKALPRCEILFFSDLGISAYVWPSYSKHASQPSKWSACIYLKPAVALTKVRRSTSLHNLALRQESAIETQLRLAQWQNSPPSFLERQSAPFQVPHSTQKCRLLVRTYLQSQLIAYGTPSHPEL